MKTKKYEYGFTCGSMDLFHAGHVLMLKEAKEYCNILIVGLQTDPTIDRPEKNKPIQSIEERTIQLEGCRYVDKIVMYNTEDQLRELLASLNNQYSREGNTFARIIGADWKEKEFTGHDLNIDTIFNSRNHNYSSSELRKRIYKLESCK